jgi:hypothetical protein
MAFLHSVIFVPGVHEHRIRERRCVGFELKYVFSVLYKFYHLNISFREDNRPAHIKTDVKEMEQLMAV